MNALTTSLSTSGKLIAVSICILVFALSCGNKQEDKNSQAPQGMISFNLNKYGKPFSIFIPDTSSVKLNITEQSSGALEIRVGKNFGISIYEQLADIELKKTDIKEDEVNKLKRFITDSPEAIFWESELAQPEFHFLVNKKINNADYSFEDLFNSESNGYKKEAVQKMYDSCNNVQASSAESKS